MHWFQNKRANERFSQLEIVPPTVNEPWRNPCVETSDGKCFSSEIFNDIQLSWKTFFFYTINVDKYFPVLPPSNLLITCDFFSGLGCKLCVTNPNTKRTRSSEQNTTKRYHSPASTVCLGFEPLAREDPFVLPVQVSKPPPHHPISDRALSRESIAESLFSFFTDIQTPINEDTFSLSPVFLSFALIIRNSPRCCGVI